MESAKELQGRILLVDDESAILRIFQAITEGAEDLSLIHI